MEFLTTEISLTLTMPVHSWIAMTLIPIVAGKMMQQGGVRFARDERWAFDTLFGALVLSAPFLLVILLIGLSAFEGLH